MVANLSSQIAAFGILTVLAMVLLIFKQRRRLWTRPKLQTDTGDLAAESLSSEIRDFRALEEEFSTLGCGRRDAETPRSWIARVSRDGNSIIDEAKLSMAHALVEALYRHRYGPRAWE